jgi:hypothetical protein
MTGLAVSGPEAALLVRASLSGAPIRVGREVEVLDGDASADLRYVGQRGQVTGLLYDDPHLQLPHAPLVVVWVGGLGEELFFPRELREL